ncbi:3-isopropylmalate dehydratase small subunit [Desulfopila sp. IMCC35006]|uniref:3-isopropylmalate dehydratase small subunit n=1 Tax=Desulfopila sp. IMCC35006 TaxID=2569542 RepID=UPI0010AD69EE|nr:3-isopropylmalate dehydratase small subunit [Desulfopila sp. IMCC35006]TKB27578.1 3-isopropylmalate dehydratase small subunit [Desulfopila sp. IMCC35006]
MKQFGGPAIFLDRSNINTDEIIPAKYLTEISKTALKPHLLEDLLLDGKPFDPQAEEMKNARVVITRANFGCGSSREHAVWAFEVNNINVVVAESFARIFRQNMFNCGILAVELDSIQLDSLFAMKGRITIAIDLEKDRIKATSDNPEQEMILCSFAINAFDKELVATGGWLAYADSHY